MLMLVVQCEFCLPQDYVAPERNEIVPLNQGKGKGKPPKPPPTTACYLLDSAGGRLTDGAGGYLTCG